MSAHEDVFELNTVPPLDPEEIARKGTIEHPRYRSVVGRIGTSISLYFEEGHTLRKRQTLIAIAEEYLDLMKGQVNRIHLDGKRTSPLNEANLGKLRSLPVSASPAAMMYFALLRHEHANPDDPSTFQMMAFGFGTGDSRRPVSGLRVYAPAAWSIGDPEHMVATVLRWASVLGALHGTAGLGVLHQPGSTDPEPVFFPVLKRYPGLDFDDMGTYWSELAFDPTPDRYERVRASNWLTLVGDRIAGRIGGEAALRSFERRGVGFGSYSGGFVLRAGDRPELGDTRRGYIPQAYRIVATTVAPVRFEGYRYSLFRTPEDVPGGSAAIAWLRRFD